MTTTKVLYANLDAGDLTCLDHAGAYLTASIQKNPRLRNHHTPFGTWAKLSQEEIDYLSTDEDGSTIEIDCSNCAFKNLKVNA